MPRSHRHPGPDVAADPRVELLISAASAPVESGPQPGEAEALAAFRQAFEAAASSSRPRKSVWRSGAVAALTSALLLSGGVTAAAVSGSLPGPAQETARTWLEQVGVEVPGRPATPTAPAEDAQDAGDDGTTSGDAGHPAGIPDEQPRGAGEDGPEAAAKGKAVSRTARDPELTGREKGAAVSALASEGRSRAGQHGRRPGDRPSFGKHTRGRGPGEQPAARGAQMRSLHAPPHQQGADRP